jgi:hypothetical protein
MFQIEKLFLARFIQLRLHDILSPRSYEYCRDSDWHDQKVLGGYQNHVSLFPLSATEKSVIFAP